MTPLDYIKKNTCPCCLTPNELYEGPSGGMCMNLRCGVCDSIINVGFGFGTGPLMAEIMRVGEKAGQMRIKAPEKKTFWQRIFG